MYTEVDRHYSECAGSILYAMILRVIKLWVDLETEDSFVAGLSFIKENGEHTHTMQQRTTGTFIYICYIHHNIDLIVYVNILAHFKIIN